MPSVPVKGPYRFFFYAGDRNEPPHIHVERENMKAKFWLKPVRLQSSGGFGPNEINRIQRLGEDYQGYRLRRWNEFFRDRLLAAG
jgi:rubredoxin